VFSYQQTVQNALEQVSNSLVASQKNREFREQQELLTKAAQQADQFSDIGRLEHKEHIMKRLEKSSCRTNDCSLVSVAQIPQNVWV
jgi:hypothetical protein